MFGSRLMLTVVISTTFIAGVARAGSLPKGHSIGEPDSAAVQALMNEGPLATLETDIDSPYTADQDISGWSDEQVSKAYQESLEQVQFWLDAAHQSPSALSALAQDNVASLKGGGRGHSLSGVACLAMAIQGEAGGEPDAGKQAVAATIMSRAGSNPTKVCSAIFAHAQFESMSHRQVASAASLRVAKEAINDKVGCTWDHFINKKLELKMGRKIPQWVHNMDAKGCPHQTIGEQTYYKACACGL